MTTNTDISKNKNYKMVNDKLHYHFGLDDNNKVIADEFAVLTVIKFLPLVILH